MVHAIRERVTVEAGGVIRLRRPELREGASAEVIVLVEDSAAARAESPRRMSDLFGKAKGSFASAQEADGFLRAERDAWDD